MPSSNHSFEEKTFANLTYCDYCSKLLWGLAKQGLECTECHYICHNKCSGSTPSCQSVKANPPSPSHSDSPSKAPKSPNLADSPAAKSLRQIQNADQQRGKLSKHKSTPSVRSFSSQSGFDSDSSIYESNKDESKKTAASANGQDPDFKHHLKDVIMSSAVNASTEDIQAPAMLYLMSQPALNPQLTTRNFTRFVSKCGPIFAFRDGIIRLICWENTADTLLAMVVWCVICFYPVLVVFGPQLLLLRIIIGKFYQKYGKNDNETLTEEPESDDKMSVKSTSTSTSTTPQPSPVQQRQTSKRSLTGFGLTSVLFAADDTSPEYLSNLKNLQNMMGEFSDAYDLAMSKASHFDWSSETQTMYLLQATLISMFGLAVSIWIVPWRFVFMFGGLSVFLFNTKFVQLVLRDMGPDLAKHSESILKVLGAWYRSLEETAGEQGVIKESSLFENQRWWPGSGFTPQMLRAERGPWSDVSGMIPLPSKYEHKPPEGYKWEDDDWKLDKTGPWKQNFLGVELFVEPDEGGWVYSNSEWEPLGKKKDNGDGTKRDLTRRRRWVRRARRLTREERLAMYD